MEDKKEIREECFTGSASTPAKIRYMVAKPEGSRISGEKIPLMLFLHGMGERGDNLESVARHGPIKEVRQGRELPFVVIAPQCPDREVWQVAQLSALLDHAIDKYHIDTNRIYLTGLSMGGSGTWALANACPGRFAALAPICGPFTMIDPVNFASTPTWCFHGGMDGAVPVTHSLQMIKRIRAAGCDARLTIYPDAEHDSWSETYANPEFYEWLLQHRLD